MSPDCSDLTYKWIFELSLRFRDQFPDLELSLEPWNVIAGISGFDN